MRVLIVAAPVLWCALTLQAAQPSITPAEREHVVKLLEDSQNEFMSYVDGLTDAQWNFKPGPDRWSIGETAEHIMLAEGGLFGRAEKALASPENPDWEKKTAGKSAFIERVMTDRSHKVTAPEAIRPTGLSREEVIRRYKEGRAKTLMFIRETDAPLNSHTAEHPFPVFGTLSAYQYILYIPLHNMRHDQQIAEVKASPGYPK
jgi:hypothetical protein